MYLFLSLVGYLYIIIIRELLILDSYMSNKTAKNIIKKLMLQK